MSVNDLPTLWEISHCIHVLRSNIPVFLYNKLVDLLAENNSPTQVSTRFTDQVQTKEPIGKNLVVVRMPDHVDRVMRTCENKSE